MPHPTNMAAPGSMPGGQEVELMAMMHMLEQSRDAMFEYARLFFSFSVLADLGMCHGLTPSY
jgi:hypothetical protein